MEKRVEERLPVGGGGATAIWSRSRKFQKKNSRQKTVKEKRGLNEGGRDTLGKKLYKKAEDINSRAESLRVVGIKNDSKADYRKKNSTKSRESFGAGAVSDLDAWHERTLKEEDGGRNVP